MKAGEEEEAEEEERAWRDAEKPEHWRDHGFLSVERAGER